MLAVTGKKLSALYREIEAQYGALRYAEASFTMTPVRKPALQQYLFEQHACPEFENVDHISREDGCKVYFTDGSWVICRFSGTEPLLRMAAEAETDEKPSPYIQTWKAFPVALSAALDSPRFRWYNYAIKKPVEPAESVFSMEIQVRAYT